jgi:hypothetical protein
MDTPENYEPADEERALRATTRQYLDRVSPERIGGVVSVSYTGSIARESVDEHSDVDLILGFVEGGIQACGDDLAERVQPRDATRIKCVAGDKCRFRWRGTEFDVLFRDIGELRRQDWDQQQKWAYTSEILYDPDDRMRDLLDEKRRFAPGERAATVREHAKVVCWFGRKEWKKWLRRNDPLSAHYMLTKATESTVKLLYLREGEFVPNDKWLVGEVSNLAHVDDQVERTIRAAFRVEAHDAEDARRRADAVRELWDGVKRDLYEEGLIREEKLDWST